MARDWEHWDSWRRWLEARKDEHGYTSQRQLARDAGITPALVSQWLMEDGEHPRPSTDNCRLLAKVFNLPILTVYVAAGYLTAEEARMRPAPEPDIGMFNFHQLQTQANQLYRELENERDELRKTVEELKEARSPEHPEKPGSTRRRGVKQHAG